ncbi:VOC family protein [Roseicella frigidaeris]|nr:VOC family protein [Roseicella frigidaeris]
MGTGTGPILGLDQVVLAVADLAPAAAAYATLFGRPCEGRGTAEGLDRASFRLANTRLVLAAPQGIAAGEAAAFARHLAPPAPGQGAGPHGALGGLGFAVAETGAALRLLERRGLPAAGPARPWLGRPAVPLDPAAARGLHLLLTEPDPDPPAGPVRLDHLVIRSGDPERTLALLAGRLGLELRLDRSNPAWGTRLLFFRCGDTVLEVSHALAEGVTAAPDTAWGLTWRVPEVAAEHARLAAAGLAVSPLRPGRKPGTRIFTLREPALGVPTAVIGA